MKAISIGFMTEKWDVNNKSKKPVGRGRGLGRGRGRRTGPQNMTGWRAQKGICIKNKSKKTSVDENTTDVKSLFDEIVDVGIEYDNHESDLYVKDTPATREILKKYKYENNVESFVSQIDGSRWFDIPFAYQPFWDKINKRRIKEQTSQDDPINDKKLIEKIKSMLAQVKTLEDGEEKKELIRNIMQEMSALYEPEAKEIVDSFEKDPIKTTRGNYGKYMSFLSNPQLKGLHRGAMVIALRKAGAGRGLEDALKIIEGNY